MAVYRGFSVKKSFEEKDKKANKVCLSTVKMHKISYIIKLRRRKT